MRRRKGEPAILTDLGMAILFALFVAALMAFAIYESVAAAAPTPASASPVQIQTCADAPNFGPSAACFEVWVAEPHGAESFELTIAYASQLMAIGPVSATGIGAHCLLQSKVTKGTITIASACPQLVNGTGAIARFWATGRTFKLIDASMFFVARCVIDEDATRCVKPMQRKAP